ncbi:MAG: ABC transporter permease, partial [Syntrophothermus sp.]
ISLFIANRYTLSPRNSRLISLISVISITGIAIGVATLIIALTVIKGFEKAISDKLVQLNSHIQISSFSNRPLPNYEVTLPVLERRLKQHATGISPFVLGLAIIKSRNATEGTTFKGILPEYNIYNLQGYMTSGKLDLTLRNDLPPISIGRKLADKLFVKVGDRVTIFNLNNNNIQSNVISDENPPSIKQFRVSGIFESGMAEYDDQFSYINLNTAQDLMKFGNRINGYDIRINDISKADSLAQNLTYYLGYPYYARSIFKIYQHIFTWIDLQKKLVPISLVLIVIVAVFNIISTLLMIVLERSGAIGTLGSLGARKKQIISIFLVQGIYLSIAGILLGNLIAYILSILQDKFDLISLPESVYFMSKAPILIDWQNYLFVSLATFALCIIAALIPSYIASRIRPISALRFE